MATAKSAGKSRAAGRTHASEAVPKARAQLGAGRQILTVPDLQKFLNSFKLPGVDLKAIVDSGHADLKAVTLANRRAFQGMQALARRQGEMLHEAAAEWRTAVKGLESADAEELLTKRTALADQMISRTLTKVRELAESSARSQSEACAAARASLREHLAGLKKAVPR